VYFTVKCAVFASKMHQNAAGLSFLDLMVSNEIRDCLRRVKGNKEKDGN